MASRIESEAPDHHPRLVKIRVDDRDKCAAKRGRGSGSSSSCTLADAFWDICVAVSHKFTRKLVQTARTLRHRRGEQGLEKNAAPLEHRLLCSQTCWFQSLDKWLLIPPVKTSNLQQPRTHDDRGHGVGVAQHPVLKLTLRICGGSEENEVAARANTNPEIEGSETPSTASAGEPHHESWL